MKTLICLSLLLLVSCTTSPYRKQIEQQQEIVEDTIKQDKITGGDLPSWVYKNGIENGHVYVVGKAEFDVNKSPFYVEKAAVMDGETRLISDAPSDFRVLTQNAITGAGIDSSEFYQIQTKLQEVVGLTGIKYHADKMECRKVIRYGIMSTAVTRACWTMVSVPLINLTKAYERTIALKFGTYKANRFMNQMQQELDKINNNPLMESKDEDTNSLGDIDYSQRKSRELPTKQVEAPSVRPEVSSQDSGKAPVRRSQGGARSSNASNGLHAEPKASRNKVSKRLKVYGDKKLTKELKGKYGSLADL